MPAPGLRFQPDGSCALVVGELNKVPEVAGGLALRIVVTGARATALPGRGPAATASLAG